MLDLPAEMIVDLLGKMMFKATLVDSEKLHVIAPPIRSDVLHACDIAEDVAIGCVYDRVCRELARLLDRCV
jgi:phenylalanyl-tRNA synthetase beta chain